MGAFGGSWKFGGGPGHGLFDNKHETLYSSECMSDTLGQDHLHHSIIVPPPTKPLGIMGPSQVSIQPS